MGTKILYLATCLLWAMHPATAQFEQHEWGDLGESKTFIGVSLLGIEAIAPLLGAYLSDPPPTINHVNPLKRIGDDEPFLEDNAWHMVGAASLVEINNQIFTKYFNMNDPKFLSAALSLSFWTSVEVMDAETGDKFNLQTEAADAMGVAFALLRMYVHPFPFEVRIGVKEWNSVGNLIENGSMRCKYDTFYDTYYSIMKTELIYKYSNFFCGVALSKQHNELGDNDVWGLTIGYDYISYLNNVTKGWWNSPVNFLDRHFTISAGFTLWQ